MLSTNVKTTSDLMSIALRAEHEAIRRYSQLAARMREGSNELTAALFERMVFEEQKHLRLLQEWMVQENIRENTDIGPVSWHDPQVSTTYDDEARDPYYSTPYRALAFAVHNEELAFRFYTHVAAESENEAVRKYAEVLAREELGHAALLRAERRRAYHAERETSSTEPRLDPETIHTEVDLLTAALHIDRRLFNDMKKIAADHPEINHLANNTQQQIIHNEAALSHQTAGEAITKSLEQFDSFAARMKQNNDDMTSRIQRLCACCDRSFTFYDAVVEAADDEDTMLAAQQLTSTALDRIDSLRQVFGNKFLCDDIEKNATSA